MPYEEAFVLFWEQVKESLEDGSFAKLTMAKTIGKLELKNIFIRPISSLEKNKVLVKYSYRPTEMEDVEEEFTLNKSFEILKDNLKNPFLTVLLFTTQKDLTFKINKKGAGNITEHPPTFQHVVFAN
ncbi:hypothetical protein [uncultured Polaribacter sp.]|uniref:hypothetical protein n=1 Tax=uncultured Polaribacter sp. TaxID=174711 RepID=UPI0026394BEA|nr:hypothetical protein [uncultured Polaribacter sp.]